ncbi:MAG: hypothetical protein EBR93_05490 [Bacteroidetes bacterium]|nr:hypothetical protein [Bacteroidota bacterium]
MGLSGMTVCLYSKYSASCVDFFQDMVYLRGIKMLCIDNEEVRRIIENDRAHYEVMEVPCIMVFYKNGRLDKYEGLDAFSWIQDRKQRIIMSSRLLTSVMSSTGSQVDPATAMMPTMTMRPTISTPAPVQAPTAPIQQVYAAQAPKQEPAQMPMQMPVISRPVLPVVQEEVEVVPNVPEGERMMGDPVMQDVSDAQKYATTGNSSVLKKKENILAMAASMAKQRESEFEANDPKRGIPTIGGEGRV